MKHFMPTVVLGWLAAASPVLGQPPPEAAPVIEAPPPAPAASDPDPTPAPAEPAAAPPAAPEPTPRLRKRTRSAAPQPDAGTAAAAADEDAAMFAPFKAPPESELVLAEATQIFTLLLQGNARAIVGRTLFPFHLEDRRFDGPDELLSEWVRHLSNKRTELLTLNGVEVYTPSQMQQKFGQPPARLMNLPWRAANTLIAVGNLSGRPVIGLFRAQGGQWRLVGFHD